MSIDADISTPNPLLAETSSHDVTAQCTSHNNGIACSNCSLTDLCIPAGVDKADLEKLDEIIVRHTPLKRGQFWFRAGERFRAIYAVRSGCLKTFVTTSSGEEQICGFHLPGEIIGLDAIDSGYYKSSARVLQSSSVCEIPFEQLDHIFHSALSLQHQMLRIMSREIDNEQWLITLLGKSAADARVAAFLCNLSNRFAARGYSATEFVLGMPRHDIGNYLGLAVETVCRVITRFQKENMLTANGKQIRINDLKQLYEITGTLKFPDYVS